MDARVLNRHQPAFREHRVRTQDISDHGVTASTHRPLRTPPFSRAASHSSAAAVQHEPLQKSSRPFASRVVPSRLSSPTKKSPNSLASCLEIEVDKSGNSLRSLSF
ncbi:hypothetical protein Nepgr_027399 [Nepenthes gracilis]|uniref:Uncharacterized protein n=1 Tax=Nepenthes gracilis TaxID=150966 RepID=A0AAD3TAF6_NEPGR|nr:hypothetical protein Nepgr_027399 [Nepenthes gracilis]